VAVLGGTEMQHHITTTPIAQAEPTAQAARLTTADNQECQAIRGLPQVEHIMEIELVETVVVVEAITQAVAAVAQQPTDNLRQAAALLVAPAEQVKHQLLAAVLPMVAEEEALDIKLVPVVAPAAPVAEPVALLKTDQVVVVVDQQEILEATVTQVPTPPEQMAEPTQAEAEAQVPTKTVQVAMADLVS
jgi:hypothetical protein